MKDHIKNLSVVFPIFIDKETKNNFYIMMGLYAPGKRLFGLRNGYGGKCEAGEAPIDCAVREVKEEIGLDLDKEKLVYVGLEVENDKQIYFYLYFFEERILVPDNTEFTDNKWLLLKNTDSYVHEMFPGNIEIVTHVQKFLENYPNYPTFALDFSDNQEIKKFSSKIYD